MKDRVGRMKGCNGVRYKMWQRIILPSVSLLQLFFFDLCIRFSSFLSCLLHETDLHELYVCRSVQEEAPALKAFINKMQSMSQYRIVIRGNIMLKHGTINSER